MQRKIFLRAYYDRDIAFLQWKTERSPSYHKHLRKTFWLQFFCQGLKRCAEIGLFSCFISYQEGKYQDIPYQTHTITNGSEVIYELKHITNFSSLNQVFPFWLPYPLLLVIKKKKIS